MHITKRGGKVVYFPENKKAVLEGAVLEWVMQGRPGREANIEVNLKIHFVELPDYRQGITLDVVTDNAVRVTALQPDFDTIQHQGRVVWIKGMNGVVLKFEGNTYPLFTVEKVEPGLGGDIYFQVLPTYFGDGNIIYGEGQFLELAR